MQRLYVAQPNRAKARNAGIAAASGEIVAFVDDDVWLPQKFMAAHASAHEIGTMRAVSGPILNVPSYDDQPKPTLLEFLERVLCMHATCRLRERALDLTSAASTTAFDLYGWEDTELVSCDYGSRASRAGAFSWDAYLYHIKPPGSETLDVLIGKTLEKATMAARFVRKISDSARVRAATGAYPLNLARAKAEGSFLAFYAGLASSRRLPRAVTEMAKARLLDGLYVERLRRELDAHSAS